MSKHIQIYKNAFSKEQCDFLIRQMQVRGKQKTDVYFLETWQVPLSDEIYTWFDACMAPFLSRYESVGYYDFPYYLKPELMQMIRMEKGDKRWLHAGDPHQRHRVSLSTLLFLNDDFEGGELVFPDEGLVIKPKKGMLVIFPSCYLFPHEVLEVSGEKYRYTLTRGYHFKAMKGQLRREDYQYNTKLGPYKDLQKVYDEQCDKFSTKESLTKKS